MKALLEKIRKILRSRRTRQMMTRFVSGIAAVVVFVTTYALVLPAITLEQNASCGIPEHQHTDACYEERLVCGLSEGEGHHHDASCYDKILICGQEVHVHSPECYQEDSSAVVSSGSAAAASTAFGAAADSAVLYGTDGSENDDEALVTDSYTAGEDAGEEGVEETAETAAEEFAAEESASDQAVGESGTDNTAAEGSNSGESDAEEADEKRDTAAGEYGKGEAAPEESAQDGSDSGIADPEGLKDSEDRNSKESKTSDTTDSKEAVNGSASDTSDAENEDAAASGTEEAANEATTNVLPEPVETENLSEGYVPELDSIELGSVLNKYTDFYYFHPEQGQEIPETSAEVTDWKKVKNGLFGSTKLESTDLVRMYLSYTIPAGALNETNQVVRYRLPSNIHLTDEQIIAINETENGMSALYADAASGTGEQAQDENQTEDENAAGYQKYLGAEAIEGTRRPDQKLKEGAQEYISAIVKAENVFDDEGIYGEKGAFLGQDLIFVFTPYSIEKNQITYNADGDPLSAGEKITGWFACDFNMSQIDWVEQDTDLDNSTVEKTAEITFVEKNSEENIREISRTLKLVDGSEDKSDAAAGETAGDAQIAASAETAAAAETASAAETSVVAETAGTADTASEKASEDKAAGAEDKEDAEDGPFKAGTLTADGDGYKITLDYTEKAEIPENVELSVREITAETDKEAYEACLEQAVQQVAADEKTDVDRKASCFFDIEILVRDTDSEEKEETRKIEPAAPVSVNIQIIDDQAAEDSGSEDSRPEDKSSGQTEPAVLHFAEEGVEQIDAEVKDS